MILRLATSDELLLYNRFSRPEIGSLTVTSVDIGNEITVGVYLVLPKGDVW